MRDGYPLLIPRDEAMDLKRAAAHAGRSTDTLRRWHREHGIGRQNGITGRLEISALALEMVLHGDWQALQHLRADQRQHPSVRRYLDHLGIAG